MDYTDIMNLRNETNPYALEQGIYVTALSEGCATVSVNIQDYMKNPAGSTHGGLLYTLCDVATAAAGASYGYHVTTVDCSFYFLRAAINVPELFAEAREIKHGRRVMVFEADVKDREGTLYCRGIFTIMKLKTPLQGGRTKEPAE